MVDGQQQVEIDHHEETINQLLDISFSQNNLLDQEKRSMESVHEINQEIEDISQNMRMQKNEINLVFRRIDNLAK